MMKRIGKASKLCDEASSGVNEVLEGMSKMELEEIPGKAMISTNEFYYGMNLQNDERDFIQKGSRSQSDSLESSNSAKTLNSTRSRKRKSKPKKIPKPAVAMAATIQQPPKCQHSNEVTTIASNEYYYQFNFGGVEKAALERMQSFKLTMKPENTQKKGIRELKAIKTPSTISAVNQTKASSKATSKESADNSTALLEHLKLLQSGKITSVQNNRTNPLPQPKKAAIKEEEMKRNKDEVQRLNSLIQQKISQQIKPKLRQIINTPRASLSNETPEIDADTATDLPTSTRPRIAKTIQKPTRAVPIVKTTVDLPSDEKVDIYRYSKDDLHQLQSLATFEVIPKLKELEICTTSLNDLDVFLLKLLLLTDENIRQSTILEEAEKRNLIERKGSLEFSYRTIPTIEEEKAKVQEVAQTQQTNEIDILKAQARSISELNRLVYQFEFKKIFADIIKDQNLGQLPFDSIVDHLVDSNQAHIIEGEIRINGKNNQEAYVSNSKGGKDVCITKTILRMHSLQGDLVRVLVKRNIDEDANVSSDSLLDDESLDVTTQSDTNSKRYGCVLEILEKRHSRRVIGTFRCLSKHLNKCTFSARDTRVPDLKLDEFTKGIEFQKRTLMVAEITSWNIDQPYGKIVEVIGEKGHLKAENDAILQQHNLSPQPFAQEILDQLPSDPFVIPANEFSYRQDLRKKLIFSIDPETARDLDDALSCELLPNGNFLIGVHISDVSYFVKENSQLDQIVKEKATSIYLVDKVYHMLPEALCMLCSLLPGADKMSYSVFWEMNGSTAEIISTRFTRSVLNSSAKLSYDHAQMVIEKSDENWADLESHFPEIHNGFTVADVANVIVQLQKLALIMRSNRRQNGALKIDQPKLSFKFDKEDQRMEAPVGFFQYCQKDSNRLIEEFMLLANISVAKFIYEKYPKISLLRHHEPPNEGGLKKLVKILSKHGLQFDTTSSSSISASMESLISGAKETAGMNAVLNLLVSKTMSRANYYCSDIAKEEKDFWHYALSIPIYTHFTSPIRRYADILVHRALNAALEYEAAPVCSPDDVQSMAVICNAQKYLSKLAGDDSVNLYFMQFLQQLPQSKTFVGGVLGIYDYNMEIVLIETGHALKVYYKILQQSDDIIIKAFADHSPPYVTAFWPKLQKTMKIQFASEISLRVEAMNEKLVANRIFFSQK